jgi:hypothetical protein
MNEPLRRPSLREAARRGAAARQQTQAQPAAKPAKRIEQVAAKCGHAVPFELHPDGKDKWRESRRKLLTERDCPECRQKAHEERTKLEKEAARQRRAARPKPEARVRERLPHGARFDGLVWDADKGLWTGTLTVPASTPGGEPAVFTASAPAVFKLLRVLDEMYRAALLAGAEPEDGGAA